jgi:hypothetical protein
MSSNQYFRRIFQSTGNVEDTSPFKYLKATVNLSTGFSEGDLIPLSTKGLPYGCVVTQLGYNSNNSLPGGVNLRAGVAYGEPETPEIPDTKNITYLGTALIPTNPPPVAPGSGVNGGKIYTLTSNNVVPQPPGTSPFDRRQQFPVVRIGSLGLDPTPGASITVTIVYVCP